MLMRESQIQPLCVVFEDLHWVDAETQGLLDALVESLPTARILLLVNYRPEYGHGWGGKTYYSQLRLDPLAPESAEELLGALLGDDDDLEPLKRLLVERTEGVPFFLEESVRTLVETGALAGERGRYRLGRSLDTIQVPATVQAILAARIDRLPPEDKTLLQTAAVIGKDVPFVLLQAISGLPEEALRLGLARLQGAEFLYETALFPELEYTFKHALIQEVAYGGLLQERRRDLHARIVRVFDGLYPGRAGEQTSWLTLHAFRGELWDRAVTYLRGSELPNLDGYLSGFTGGDDPGAAWWVGDHEHAIRAALLERSVIPHLGGSWQLSLRLAINLRVGQAHHSLGQYLRAIDALRKNVDLLGVDLLHERCNMAGLPSVFSRAWLALCLAERGEFVEAVELGEQALAIAATGDPGYSFTVGCAGLGNVFVARGDFVRAIELLERGLARELDEHSARAWPFIGSALGAAYTFTGRLGDALPLLEESVARAAAVKLKANQSFRLARLGEAHLLAGQPHRAFPLAAQALDLAQEQRERGYEAHALRLLAAVEMAREGSVLERAEEGYRKAVALAESLGMRPLIAHCHLGLGKLYRRAGSREPAHEHLTTATTMYREMGVTYWLEKAEGELPQ
jgi:tetratricopeptide (TPR) repeat protein